jgi:hypothetical protein
MCQEMVDVLVTVLHLPILETDVCERLSISQTVTHVDVVPYGINILVFHLHE